MEVNFVFKNQLVFNKMDRGVDVCLGKRVGNDPRMGVAGETAGK